MFGWVNAHFISSRSRLWYWQAPEIAPWPSFGWSPPSCSRPIAWCMGVDTCLPQASFKSRNTFRRRPRRGSKILYEPPPAETMVDGLPLASSGIPKVDIFQPSGQGWNLELLQTFSTACGSSWGCARAKLWHRTWLEKCNQGKRIGSSMRNLNFSAHVLHILAASGKLSTWFPPGGLVETTRTIWLCMKAKIAHDIHINKKQCKTDTSGAD